MLRSKKIELAVVVLLAIAVILAVGSIIPTWVSSVPYGVSEPPDDVILKRAEFGEGWEQNILARRCEKGKPPCSPQNYSDAAKWYTKSANQGHPYAAHSLGKLYAEGLGVKQSDEEAYFWLYQYPRLRKVKSQLILDSVEAKLTHEQKDAVQKRLKEWSPSLSENVKSLARKHLMIRVSLFVASLITPFLILTLIWRRLQKRKHKLWFKIMSYSFGGILSFICSAFLFSQRLRFLEPIDPFSFRSIYL